MYGRGSKILHAHFRERRSIKGISRNFAVSGATVRNVLHSRPTTSFHEMRTQPNPKIITWRLVLDVMLSENADHPGRETSMPMISVRDEVFFIPSFWSAVLAGRNQMFKTMKRGSAELLNRMDRACHFKLKQ